jgi:hypothetical protein
LGSNIEAQVEINFRPHRQETLKPGKHASAESYWFRKEILTLITRTAATKDSENDCLVGEVRNPIESNKPPYATLLYSVLYYINLYMSYRYICIGIDI